jgi:large subunit ribosomal protein L3
VKTEVETTFAKRFYVKRIRVKALITRKLGMTSAIAEDGRVAAVTLLSASDNVITQIKSKDTDGYQAIQLGFEDSKKLSKPILGHLKAAKANSKVMCEIRVDEIPELKVGEKLSADLFSVGDKVDAVSTSKGKGFAGTIKRHNFHLGRKTHGGRSYRRPGSIGSMYPQKIFKGKKMAGQMGDARVTVKNLSIALVDNEHNVIGVFGAVPGPKKSVVVLKGIK